jgi:hypothetical protein
MMVPLDRNVNAIMFCRPAIGSSRSSTGKCQSKRETVSGNDDAHFRSSTYRIRCEVSRALGVTRIANADVAVDVQDSALTAW